MKTEATSKSRWRSRFVVALAAVGMLAVLVVPAHADGTSPGVAVFRGCATIVGNDGHGLFFPPSGPTSAQWAFRANDAQETVPVVSPDNTKQEPGCVTGNNLEFCKSVSNAGLQSCKISAVGHLAATATPKGVPLGGWCGLSSGFSGRGLLKTYDLDSAKDNATTVKLYKLGWITSAGSVLPVTGRWTSNVDKVGPHDPEQNKKLGKNGTVVALVQAFGGNLGAGCAGADPGGATAFDVNAVAALL